MKLTTLKVTASPDVTLKCNFRKEKSVIIQQSSYLTVVAIKKIILSLPFSEKHHTISMTQLSDKLLRTQMSHRLLEYFFLYQITNVKQWQIASCRGIGSVSLLDVTAACIPSDG